MITKSKPLMVVFTLVLGFLGTEIFAQGRGVPPNNDFFNTTGFAPKLVPFSTEAAAKNLARTRKVVYFFAAEWCELCKRDLDTFRANIESIPNDVTIVLVDFDTADGLRIKYGIPLQDVFILIDRNGTNKKLWVGGGLEALIKNTTT